MTKKRLSEIKEEVGTAKANGAFRERSYWVGLVDELIEGMDELSGTKAEHHTEPAASG